MSKTVVLGVTGGIAAYKACDIVSRLRKLNIDVYVIMTKHAAEFVSPLTFQSLSQNYVTVDMFESPKSWDIEHISLAKRADVFLIAPATANVIAKISAGIADDMLTTTVMATRAPVVIAPAMNTNMYENPITQGNIERLESFGYHFIQPGCGRLACNDIGRGKLEDPEVIVEHVEFMLNRSDRLKGKKIMITAGPTTENIDPVRFISNRSTGKMGYSLAGIAAQMGAEVTLISGKTDQKPPFGIKRFIEVQSALEMYDACTEFFDETDVVVKSAAVADYRPKNISASKIKKQPGDMSIELTRNPDILMELGKRKKDQILVGFAAETDDLIENAMKKIKNKNLDLIVANNVKEEGAGFGHDTNVVSMIDKDMQVQNLPMMSKVELAIKIYDRIIDMLNKK